MTDSGMIDITEFTCPRCGSHKFGTTLDPMRRLDLRTSVGHCHGDRTVRTVGGISLVRCEFSWSRVDDAKYFRKTGEQQAAVHVGTMERS